MTTTTTIDLLLTGKAEIFGPKGEASGYVKTAVDGSLMLDWDGLSSDQQADRENHGGVDKALFQYCSDHYQQWQQRNPEHRALLERIGAFGENISARGLHEENVYIGDRFQIGEALVEVSQGRQPCWKLGHFFNDQSMVKAVVDTAMGGWYYRVLERGKIGVGDPIELVDRPNPQMPVKKAFEVLVARKKDDETVAKLVDMPALSKSWTARARKIHLRRSSQ